MRDLIIQPTNMKIKWHNQRDKLSTNQENLLRDQQSKLDNYHTMI